MISERNAESKLDYIKSKWFYNYIKIKQKAKLITIVYNQAIYEEMQTLR